MSPIETTATVGPDGRVHLDLLVGAECAGREVKVTVAATDDDDWRRLSQEEYARRVESPAGSISDPAFDPHGDRPSAIQYPPGYRRMTREEWKRFIAATAGSIDDPSFVRPPDMPVQDRGPIFP